MHSYQRYQALDGLRGLAALAIVIWHEPNWFPYLRLPTAHIAVDLFFVISGFVIAASYESRLKAGLSVSSFMLIRIIRLYPFYLFGTLISIISLVLSFLSRGTISEFHLALWRAALFSAFMLPSPSFGILGNLYPLNIPAWSLHFEIIINIIWALTYKSWSGPILYFLTATFGLLLLIFPDFAQGGNSYDNYGQGLARVCFSFPAGVLIYRLRDYFSTTRKFNIIYLALFFLFATSLPFGIWTPFIVVFVLPILVGLSINSSLHPRTTVILSIVGTASYGLYAIHMPLMSLVNASISKLNLTAPSFIIGVIFLFTTFLFSLIATKYYEIPARKFLARNLIKKSSTTHVKVNNE